MFERIFELAGTLIVVGIALIAFLLPTIVGAMRGVSGIRRGIEGAVLALIGGLLSRAFISAVLAGGNDSPGACLVVGWAFFLAPGVIDAVLRVVGQSFVLSPDTLLMLGGTVGGFTGMMGGIYQIYDWTGLGWLFFPLDVTWALAGNTVGSLMHILNHGLHPLAPAVNWFRALFGLNQFSSNWGLHTGDARSNAHRYADGFGLRPDYAFTQGCVMSNLSDPPGADLYRHEFMHVRQGRGFGACYTLSYLGWMVVWVVPAIIVGIVITGLRGVGVGPNTWCYFNNPWETWAYFVQDKEHPDHDTRLALNDDPRDRRMIWPRKYVIAWSMAFAAVAFSLAMLAVSSIWFAPAPQKLPPKQAPKQAAPAPAHRPHAQLLRGTFVRSV